MPRGYTPDHYGRIQAAETSISKARATKEELGVTWNTFLESAAEELQTDS